MTRASAAARGERATRVEPLALKRRLRSACLAHGVDYDVGRGKRIPIPLIPVPLALSASYLRYVHALSEAVNRHLRAMPSAWFADPALREVLVFPPAERRFVESVWDPSHARAQTVVSRNDFDMPADPRDAVAFEANGCAIGGIWYGAAAARVGCEVLLPDLRGSGAAMIHDGYEVFVSQLRAHARAVGLPRRFRLGLLEDRTWDAGITEMPSLLRRLKEDGWDAVLGDPRALTAGRGGLRLDGERVDLLYRNMEISDFVAIERRHGPLRALRLGFGENRVVSGAAGDFDQKALWEVLTSRRFERYVAPRDRRLLRAHLLWTRLLRETDTEDHAGRTVSLVEYALRSRARLVLKPNLLCGGEGVTLGPRLTQRAWERTIRRALREPGHWVLQHFHRASRVGFRGLGARYVTCGVISSPDAVSALGRASTDPVVNVSRGGGLVPLYRRVASRPARATLG